MVCRQAGISDAVSGCVGGTFSLASYRVVEVRFMKVIGLYGSMMWSESMEGGSSVAYS